MEAADRDLVYQKIAKDGIRLITIDSASTEDDVRVNLHYFDDVRDAPPYVALSHVWGDPNKTDVMTCAGDRFHATRNLYNALVQIQRLSGTYKAAIQHHLELSQLDDLYLWIDAICINQGSEEEKAVQIPCMGEIFSATFTVLVWLGTFEEFTYDGDLSTDCIALKRLLDENLQATSFGIPRVQIPQDHYRREATLGDMPLFRAYEFLMRTPWFSRLWVVQEVCLSQREPIVLFGDIDFSLRILHSFPDMLIAPSELSMDLIFLTDRCVEATYWRVVKFGRSYLPDYIGSPGYHDIPTTRRLLLLLRMTHYKKTTLPHDHIYGLLGILKSNHLPEELRVDYTEPFPRLCTDVTKMLIEETSDLDILHYSWNLRHRENNSSWLDYPSWTVDLRYVARVETGTNVVAHMGYFTADRNGLVVDGRRMGNLRLHWVPDLLEYSSSARLRRLRTLHDGFLAQAASVYSKSLDEMWRSWRQFMFDGMNVSGLRGAAERLASNMTDFENYVTMLVDDTQLLDDTKLICVSEHCYLHLNGQDQFAICSSTITPEELSTSRLEIWAVKGMSDLSILYRDANGDYRYKGYIWRMEKDHIELDEAFFAARKVERIKIV